MVHRFSHRQRLHELGTNGSPNSDDTAQYRKDKNPAGKGHAKKAGAVTHPVSLAYFSASVNFHMQFVDKNRRDWHK
ncbi:MAG: hypothetical protein HDT19_04395 [Oscillibacter sp.]|nr:hypothetical protein [Oscillibacter sp.]